MLVLPSTYTGLLAYNDTAYTDSLFTVTVFGSKIGSPYTETQRLEGHLLSVTILPFPKGVIVSKHTCMSTLKYFWDAVLHEEINVELWC